MTTIMCTKETANKCELFIIELCSENHSMVPQMPTTQSTWITKTKPVLVLIFLSKNLLWLLIRPGNLLCQIIWTWIIPSLQVPFSSNSKLFLVFDDQNLECSLSCFTHVWLFVTVALQALLSMGFSRQEYWSGLPFPSPRDLPDPGIEPRSHASEADSLPSELSEKLWDT